jgi:hypothetical protein
MDPDTNMNHHTPSATTLAVIHSYEKMTTASSKSLPSGEFLAAQASILPEAYFVNCLSPALFISGPIPIYTIDIAVNIDKRAYTIGFSVIRHQ